MVDGKTQAAIEAVATHMLLLHGFGSVSRSDVPDISDADWQLVSAEIDRKVLGLKPSKIAFINGYDVLVTRAMEESNG